MKRRVGPPRIFLSYRREDASGHAGRLYDVLTDRFGAENVFMDIDTIEVGADFGEAISRAVASCDALIAVIGRDWLTASDATGRRRLDDPADFVRLELEAALARDVSVVPVRVRGAPFPDAEDLPATLAPLARRQGTELRDIGWHDDVKRLLERLQNIVTPAEPRRRAWWRARPALAASVGAAALAAAVLVLVLVLPGTRSPLSGGSFPNDLERRLLAFVPPITRPHCARIDWGDESAVAAVECGGAGISATYHLFESEQVRDAWYVRTREEAAIAPLSGSCSAQVFKGEKSYNGREDGNYICWFDGRQPLVVWKHGANAVGARANAWRGEGKRAVESLLRQWRCCLRPQS